MHRSDKAITSHQTDDDNKEEDKSIYLVPELCRVHPVPLILWPALSSMPRLMWDIQGYLHAAELLSDLQSSGLSPDICPPVYLIRQALTAPSAVDSGGDYETLEALGDGLLKFAASTQLFLEHPSWHEGQLTSAKDRLVSNRKLAKVALEFGLEKRVVVTGCSTRGKKTLIRWGQGAGGTIRGTTIMKGTSIMDERSDDDHIGSANISTLVDGGTTGTLDFIDPIEESENDDDDESVEEGEVMVKEMEGRRSAVPVVAEKPVEEESFENSTTRVRHKRDLFNFHRIYKAASYYLYYSINSGFLTTF